MKENKFNIFIDIDHILFNFIILNRLLKNTN